MGKGSGVQEHDQSTMDIDTAEDDALSEEDIHQPLDVFNRGLQQADPQAKGLGSRKRKDCTKGGLSTLRDRHAHRQTIGLQDLQSIAGRCALFASCVFPQVIPDPFRQHTFHLRFYCAPVYNNVRIFR